MRQNLVYILFLSIVASCNNDKEQRIVEDQESKSKKPTMHGIPDSLFLYHFRILDSAAQFPPEDTMYHCCHSSVEFMEEFTHIPSDSESDYFGSTGFKREDLQKWHEWYDKKYGKKKD